MCSSRVLKDNIVAAPLTFLQESIQVGQRLQDRDIWYVHRVVHDIVQLLLQRLDDVWSPAELPAEVGQGNRCGIGARNPKITTLNIPYQGRR